MFYTHVGKQLALWVSIVRALITSLFFICSLTVSAHELRWGFASADGQPYVEVREHQLLGGFIYELGRVASQRLGYKADFVETPNKRIEEFMHRGRIHVICNNNPQWMKNPERFHWSEALYSEEDVLLVHRQRQPITDLEGLYGKTLGTQLGYIYSPALMDAFTQKKIVRQNLRDYSTGINLLSMHRLDAMIDMRRPVTHQLNKHPDAPVQINPWVIDRYDMHCAFSPTLPVSTDKLDEVLNELREEGVIEKLLNKN